MVLRPMMIDRQMKTRVSAGGEGEEEVTPANYTELKLTWQVSVNGSLRIILSTEGMLRHTCPGTPESPASQGSPMSEMSCYPGLVVMLSIKKMRFKMEACWF